MATIYSKNRPLLHIITASAHLDTTTKMKLLLSLAALLGVSAAVPQFGNSRLSAPRPTNTQYQQTNGNVVPIVAYSNDLNVDGSYQYQYQTGDGISAQATGSVVPALAKDADNGGVASSVQGSYSYTAPDGQVITVNYIADENGFRAEGAHIPTPPPIPAEIARSLELINAAQKNNPPIQQNYQQNRFG